MLLFITSVFFANNYYSFALLVAGALIIAAVSQLSVMMLLKGLKPIIFIAVFTAVINIFWTKGENLIFEFWIIRIYDDGLKMALFMVLRIITLILGTGVLLTYTTSPMALTDAIERLLSPLKKLHVPVHEFAMMMTIALRFIPTLIEETEKITNAQKARGADFESGKLIDRAKAMIPILIPLFVSAFRRADELAVAMECRLYHGGEGRTRMKVLKLSGRDFTALAMMITFSAGLLILNKL
ncbi:Energy-coupling factor transporter transmembrane protein EcfT [bioreactor metagenome]|uniref:Energy-coupling factor transporter transmembrane protein EcfT n=1 Tax=bioreactor metagenome TaxID=1076179 RepID=A0A645ED60_9ZZZZ